MMKQTRGQYSNELLKIQIIREKMLQIFRTIAITTFMFLLILIVVNILNIQSIRSLSWLGAVSIALSLFSGVFVFFQLLFLRQIREFRSSSNISSDNTIKTFPLTDPKTILQRKTLVEKVYAKLSQTDATAIVLTGIVGSGKSTLAGLIYRYVEEQRHTGNSSFADESLWLHISENVTMTELGMAICTALGKSVTNFNSLEPQDQAIALFTTMDSVEQKRLIVLEQLDNLLNWQLGFPRVDRPGIGEWLDALNSQLCKCRVLFTSRLSLKGTRRSSLVYIQEFPVVGLTGSEGIELLCKQGVAESMVASGDLRKVVQRYNGHPLALKQLASILRSNQELRINIFFEHKAVLQQSGSVIDLLIHKYVELLEPVQRKLLFAFSVYREAVPIKATLVIFEEIPKKQVFSALDVLLLQHLLQSNEEGCYQLHPIVTNYALNHFDDNSDQTKQKALSKAHLRAAQYYKEQFENPEEKKMRREPKDIHPIVEAIWHLCHAGHWKEAYDLMKTKDVFQDLKRWGENDALLELYQLLIPLTEQLPDSLESIFIFTDLGRIYRTLGRRVLALDYFRKALSICEEKQELKEEGMLNSLIGSVYADLGQSGQALDHLEKALSIRQKMGDQEGEGWTFYNLSRIYHERGQEDSARQYCEHALALFRQVKNHKGEVRILNLLGRVYDHLSKKEQALKFYEEAIAISEKIGDRLGEALTLNGLALYYIDNLEKEYALELLENALKIRQEISDREGEGRTLNDLGRFYRIIGDTEKAGKYLEMALCICREIEDYEGISKTLNNLSMLQSDEEALKSLEEALRICRKIEDHRVEGWTLHNMGHVYNSLGDVGKAESYYKQALRIRRDIGDRRGEGWTIHNLGLLYLKQGKYEQTLAFFQAAREIFQEIKNSNKADIDTEIVNLQHKIGGEKFAELTRVLSLRAHITVEQVLNEDN